MQALTKFRISLSMTNFILIYSLYFGFVLNTPIVGRLIDLTANTESHFFAYTAPVLLSCAFVIIFSFLAIPYLVKPLFIFILLTSAVACYATSAYNIYFDYAMMENIFETNTGEVLSYVNLNLLGYLFLVGVVPSLAIVMVKFDKRKSLKVRVLKRFILVIIATLVLVVTLATTFKQYASVGRNNSYLNKLIVPAHIFNSLRYLHDSVFATPLTYKHLGLDAVITPSANGKPTLMVVMIGETARAMNMAYNGYSRNTNPYTQGMGIISFQDVSSCGTATAYSLPCMFANLNHPNYDRARANSQDDALDILAHAKVDVLWLDNDSGDKEVAKGVNKLMIDPAKYPDVCNGTVCYDEVMLKEFDSEVDKMQGNKLIVMHMIGSHGPTYWQRYPKDKARFGPACEQSDIENCSDEEIVNVYDNTLVYTDYVLAQVIDKLKQYQSQYNVAMLYVSDHGESLGEDGMYLHGAPYALAPDEQTKVPFFMWIPQQYADAEGINRTCLEKDARNGVYSHDNFFHTLLSLYGVKSKVIDEKLDIISACRAH